MADGPRCAERHKPTNSRMSELQAKKLNKVKPRHIKSKSLKSKDKDNIFILKLLKLNYHKSMLCSDMEEDFKQIILSCLINSRLYMFYLFLDSKRTECCSICLFCYIEICVKKDKVPLRSFY